jgi:hypothetical protein
MPTGKGYGSPSTKIGKTGNLGSGKSNGGGKHSFLPDKHDTNLKRNNTSGGTSGKSESTKIPFLPNKPE